MQADATIAANPDFAVTYSYAARAALQLRRYHDAETYLRRAAPLKANADIVPPVQLVRGIADPTQRPAALHDLANSSMDGADQAEWFCALGDDTQALAALELGLRTNAIPDITAELMWSPMFDPIRNDPRFKAVLEKMGLPHVPHQPASS